MNSNSVRRWTLLGACLIGCMAIGSAELPAYNDGVIALYQAQKNNDVDQLYNILEWHYRVRGVAKKKMVQAAVAYALTQSDARTMHGLTIVLHEAKKGFFERHFKLITLGASLGFCLLFLLSPIQSLIT